MAGMFVYDMMKSKERESVGMKNQEVYVVYGNYSPDCYSEEIKLFGIFEDEQKAKAEAMATECVMKSQAEERAKTDSYIRPERIWVKVAAVRMNLPADIYLGGYTE